MTFLELVNSLRQEADGTGAALTTLSGNLNAENARFKARIIEAWRQIQMLNNGQWHFMRRSFSAALTAGTWDYLASAAPFSIADLKTWSLDEMRCYATATGYGDEQELTYWPYEDFKRQYRFGAMRTQTGRPTVFSVDPARHLVVGPVPIAGYTVEGVYYAQPVTLSANGDIPAMPTEYHMLIVYRALLADAEFEWSQEQKVRAVREMRRMQAELEIDQLPTVSLSVTTG